MSSRSGIPEIRRASAAPFAVLFGRGSLRQPMLHLRTSSKSDLVKQSAGLYLYSGSVSTAGAASRDNWKSHTKVEHMVSSTWVGRPLKEDTWR
jgi:hypothetical protein